MAFLGAPDTCPEEDYCTVNNTPWLDRDRKEWETTTLVAWVLKGGSSAYDKTIAAAVRWRFSLHRGEVTVSLHHPEEYLLKFDSKRTQDRVLDSKKFHHEDLELHVRPWRAVSHAFGAAMFFLLRLCLEGLPVYAWTPDIAARHVGRKCSLKALEGVSASKEDTRTLNLWAWTSNPSTIAKVAWITFTHRSGDTHPLPKVSSCLPDKWKRGLTHRVIIHLDYIENHTAAPLDDFITSTDTVPYEPITSRLPWSLGAIDGMPESKGGLAACLPKHFGKWRRLMTTSLGRSIAMQVVVVNPAADRLKTTTHRASTTYARTKTMMMEMMAPTQHKSKRSTRYFDLSNVRRSSHLAIKRRSGSMLHRTQETLARKLGILPKDEALSEEALKEYLAMYNVPLPQDTIEALTHLFKLDYQLTTQADSALLELGGQDRHDPASTPADPGLRRLWPVPLARESYWWQPRREGAKTTSTTSTRVPALFAGITRKQLCTSSLTVDYPLTSGLPWRIGWVPISSSHPNGGCTGPLKTGG